MFLSLWHKQCKIYLCWLCILLYYCHVSVFGILYSFHLCFILLWFALLFLFLRFVIKLQCKIYLVFFLNHAYTMYNDVQCHVGVFESLPCSIAYNKGCTKMKTNGTWRVGGQPTKGLVKHIIPHRHGCLTTAAQTTTRVCQQAIQKAARKAVTWHQTLLKSKQTIISCSAL